MLSEVDRLSKEAQHSLRRTMEKYSSACRLVLCCNNASRVRLFSGLCNCLLTPIVEMFGSACRLVPCCNDASRARCLPLQAGHAFHKHSSC